MKKYLVVLILCIFASALYGKKQKTTVTETPQPAEKGEVTLMVDQDVSSGKTEADTEKERQDSLKQLYEKWKRYFSTQNEDMILLFDDIQQLDSTASKETVKNLKRQLDDLKEDVTNYVSNSSDVSWKDYDDLVAKHSLFFKTYRSASAILDDMEEKLSQGEKQPVNKLLIIGICLLAVMACVPIFTQVKSSLIMKKTKKQQEQLAKKQQEEMERQMLLADESNIVTLKE